MKTIKKLFLSAMCVATAASAASADTWKYVAASDGTTYAIKSDGTLWSWGWNETGQLGTNGVLTGETGQSKDYTAIPQQMSTETDWVYAVGGKANAFFMKSNNTVWSVGANSKGSLGAGVSTDSKVLLQVEGDDWKTVSPGRFFGYCVMAIKQDGSLWTWGEGEKGANGLGTYTNPSVPVQVGTDKDWKAVSVGATHSIAIKADGTLWAWGFNNHRQLGTDETTMSVNAIPHCVNTDTDWVKVFAVDYSSYAIKADGSLWAWGSNENGVLGLGADAGTADVTVPTRIMAELGKVVAISGCENVRVIGIGEEGKISKIYSWGAQADGALGNGVGAAWGGLEGYQWQLTPQEVEMPATAMPAKMLSSGQMYTMVLGANDHLYGWGRNRNGQLGDYGEQDKLGFYSKPIEAATDMANANSYTFGPDEIPAAVNSAESITLTGNWSTSDFQKLMNAVGNNSGFPAKGNESITTIDMSQATLGNDVSFYVAAGLSNAGVFANYKALTRVIMPAAEECGKISSVRAMFNNCTKLADVDLSDAVNAIDWTDAFNNCAAITSMDLSRVNFINKSESLFNGCSSLTKVSLPALIVLERNTFGNCTSLKTIDWTTFSGTEAPVFPENLFQGMLDKLGQITLIVPDDKADLFRNDANWSKLNIVGKKAPIAVQNIAEFLELGANGTAIDTYTFENPVTVELQYNAYLWVADESGVLLITDMTSAWAGVRYNEGDRVEGFTVAYVNGTANAAETLDTFAAGTAGAPLDPKEVTTSEITDQLNSQLVLVKGIKIVLSGSQSKIDGSDILVNYLTNTANLAKWAGFVAKGTTVDLAGVVYADNGVITLMTTAMDEAGTGVGQISNNVVIYGAQGCIVAPEGAKAYSVSGTPVAMDGLAPGIYVVVFENHARKVVVK